MKSPENNRPDGEESLKDLLKRRHELDQKLENRYTRLLTIMFTDIKGSTEYYDVRGDIDGRILFEKHNQILSPILEHYNGRIIKSTGDGMMIVFDSPQDGIRSAIEMQKKLWEFNKGKRKQDQLHVRISINHGKVIEDEGDVYGLEVSIASRINSLANADQILISENLYEELKDASDIICSPIQPVSVKGVQEPLQLYSVRWGHEETVDGSSGSALRESERSVQKRTVFVIGVIKEAGKIKISGHEKISGEQKTIRHYEEIKVDEEKTNRYKAEIIGLLNRANQKGHVSRDILSKLKTAGQLLYDELLSLDIKRKLAVTEADDLIVSMDDNLVDIPWELLYDGRSFLCIRFNMGRLVSTRQNIIDATPRRIGTPLKMLILSDPQGNLKSAHREGFSIRDRLDHLVNTVHINIRSSNITSAYVKENMRNYDIVHYSGHADYDSRNPSESGFLLEEGKLKASDIMSLSGAAPLPSLVFSNACKSGHTDKWTVEEHYGTEIYGLANAFLLAGVNHYVGTFWDVQDEPGLHFALAFYNELMRGAMIGEAVRKARMTLIKKFGEDTIIWASYMLYGNPTFRYVDPPAAVTGETEPKSHLEAEPVEALGNAVRSIAGSAAVHSKNRTWMLTGAGLLFILCIFFAFYLGKKKMDAPVQQISVPAQGTAKEEKQKQIDELVASLITAYEKGQKSGGVTTNVPTQPTMVFLSIKSYGINDMEKEYILLRATDILQSSKRIKVVEREVLDRLLQELKLSSSQLADPSTALKVGRILSARIISTGSIMKEGNDWQISLRLIETETTAVKAALTETFETKEKNEVAENLGRDLLQKIRSEYPLHGEIISVDEGRVTLNIGSASGVASGQRMDVLLEKEGTNIKMGEIEVVSVEEEKSYGRMISGKINTAVGMKVREVS